MDLGAFDAFAAHHQLNSWAWGKADCTLVLADWIVWNGHRDPAVNQRGSYDSEAGCWAVVEGAGGLLSLVEQCALLINLNQIDTPEFGAIAVIGSRHNTRRQWGAIFDGKDWRVRFDGGFPAVKAHPLAIWRVPCQQ